MEKIKKDIENNETINVKKQKRIILVIGPPGSGKGTQSKILEKKTGLKHISTGDMIREHIQKKTEISKLFEPFCKSGSLVPDVIINDIVIDYLNNITGDGVILDGFPRTLNQAISLHSYKGIEVERLLIIQAPDDVCINRILKRNDPQRKDKDQDRDFNIGRLKFYNENFKDIFEVFRGKVQIVNGNDDVDVVSSNIENLINLDPTKGDVNFDLLKPVIKKGDKELCIVCMTNVADYLIVPCGHQCGCFECLDSINKAEKKCPICRKHMTQLIKVFNSGLGEMTYQETTSSNNKNVKNERNILEDNKSKFKLSYDRNLENAIKISVSPSENINDDLSTNIGISINVPDIDCRVPVDVCCVIDVSGSMSDDAKFQDPEDETKTKSDGMSILDLVKHAVKTIIHTLTDNDRMSLVSFHTDSQIEYELNYMNETNRLNAVKSLENLKPLDSTDIWGGLQRGLDSIVKSDNGNYINRRKIIILLTDGQPNLAPPEGEEKALSNYLSQHSNYSFQINTFGFGYRLNSQLLVNLAKIGNGIFGFIPDAKIVGTNFVNCIANAVTSFCLNAKLHLIALGDSTFINQNERKNYEINIGNLQFGQTRDICFPMKLSKDEAYLAVILEYEGYDEYEKHKLTFIAKERDTKHESTDSYVRCKLVNETYDIIDNFSKGKTVKALKTLENLSKEVSDYDIKAENEDAIINGLLADLVGFGGRGGRMTKAISTIERFNRWGSHYLRSICRSHELQLRTNFMDCGLQVYGGETFKKLQEIGGKIFLDLPMIRSKPQEDNYNYYNNNSNNATTIDNNDYYGGSGGGCFDGDCVVEILNHKGQILKIKLSQIKKNDLIKVKDFNSGKIHYSKVLCLIKITLDKNENLVLFSDSQLKVTKKHPVFFDERWQYPIDIVKKYNKIAKLITNQTDSNLVVFNLILEDSHVIEVNGIYCVTLGHGIREIYHEFYGTKFAIDAVKRDKGFENGFVQVNHNIKNLI